MGGSIKVPSMRDIADEGGRAQKNINMKNVGNAAMGSVLGGAVMGPIGSVLGAGGGFAGGIGQGIGGPIHAGKINAPARAAALGDVALTDRARIYEDRLMGDISARQRAIASQAGQYQQAGNVGGYQASQIGYNPSVNMSTGLRNEAAGYARNLANMNVPSQAMAQHRLATDRGMKQAASLAATGRNPRGLRDALNAQAQIQGQSALQSAVVRSQEAARQQAAQGQAAGIMGSLRGQDISGSTDLARMQLARSQANQQATNQQRQIGFTEQNKASQFDAQMRGQKDALIMDQQQKALAQQAASTKAASASELSIQDMNTKRQLGDLSARTSRDVADVQSQTKLQTAKTAAEAAREGAVAGTIGAGVTGLATIFSDRNLKENIGDGQSETKSFLDALNAYTYNYKGDAPDNRYTSVMAQDLENTPGSVAVENTPEGKMVDHQKLLPLMLASMAEINERLKKKNI